MTVRIAPFQATHTGGPNSPHGHGDPPDPLVFTVQNGKSGPKEAPLVAACADVYTTAEVDAKDKQLAAKLEADMASRVKALEKHLDAEFVAKFEPLYAAFESAKTELRKAVADSLREEFRQIVEREVRRILAEMQP